MGRAGTPPPARPQPGRPRGARTVGQRHPQRRVVYPDGSVAVPFSSYAGTNTGIPVDHLTTEEFRARANTLFGFTGSERQAQTRAGWLATDRAESLATFCFEVADAYAAANRPPETEPAISAD